MDRLTRRRALAASLAGGAAAVIAACGGGDDSAPTTAARADGAKLDPTPACGDEGATPEQTEGPFFTPDSPRGAYELRSIVPGVYPGRTRHIHVKAQPRGGSVLTTQLYFPDEPANGSDGIFDPLLLVDLAPERGGVTSARFDFVLETA